MRAFSASSPAPIRPNWAWYRPRRSCAGRICCGTSRTHRASRSRRRDRRHRALARRCCGGLRHHIAASERHIDRTRRQAPPPRRSHRELCLCLSELMSCPSGHFTRFSGSGMTLKSGCRCDIYQQSRFSRNADLADEHACLASQWPERCSCGRHIWLTDLVWTFGADRRLRCFRDQAVEQPLRSGNPTERELNPLKPAPGRHAGSRSKAACRCWGCPRSASCSAISAPARSTRSRPCSAPAGDAVGPGDGAGRAVAGALDAVHHHHGQIRRCSPCASTMTARAASSR